MPFDGLRYYKESIETGQATTLDVDHARFGIGRYACPGRYMASMQIKFVVARTFMNYDLKCPEEQGVPKVVPVMEFCLPDFWMSYAGPTVVAVRPREVMGNSLYASARYVRRWWWRRWNPLDHRWRRGVAFRRQNQVRQLKDT